ncbi:hypothetical protein DXG01_010711 [Tephrocybe rancida]|nr:hypothetical protein DXG01_010711 [Tephrocybe rancida]
MEILHRTNHEATPTQRIALQAILTQKLAEFTEINAIILRAQLEMDELLKKIQALEKANSEKNKEMQTYRSMLSSVRLLPPEILATIFKHATRRSFGSPVPLSHVCSVWRETAIGTPELWTDIYIAPEMYGSKLSPSRPSDPISARLSLWLRNAGASNNISVSLKLSHSSPILTNNAIWSDLCRGVQSSAPRIMRLSTSFVCSHTHMPPLFSLSGDTFSMLEALYFDDLTNDWDHHRITVFDKAPRLHRVVMRVYTLRLEGYQPLALPWGQLTHIEFHCNISLEAFSKVMFACLELQSALFQCIDQGTEDPWFNVDRLPQHTLQHLTKLKLSTTGSNEVIFFGEILPKLQLPSMASLEVKGSPFTVEFALPDILPSLDGSCSSHTIQQLSLFFVSTNIQPLSTLIQSCVQLETLQLFITNLHPISLLTNIPTSSRSLSSLVLGFQEHAYDLVATADALGDLVLSYRVSGAPLQSVELYIFSYLQRTDPKMATMMERVNERISGVSVEFDVSSSYPNLQAFFNLHNWEPISW